MTEEIKKIDVVSAFYASLNSMDEAVAWKGKTIDVARFNVVINDVDMRYWIAYSKDSERMGEFVTDLGKTLKAMAGRSAMILDLVDGEDIAGFIQTPIFDMISSVRKTLKVDSHEADNEEYGKICITIFSDNGYKIDLGDDPNFGIFLMCQLLATQLDFSGDEFMEYHAKLLTEQLLPMMEKDGYIGKWGVNDGNMG